MSGKLILRDGDASMCVTARGAEPVAWRVGGQDLLWRGGPEWPRSSPVLFPIVGRASGDSVRIGGHEYPMPVHGFAAARGFEITKQGPASVRFTLTDDSRSRNHYPFVFRLDVSYRLQTRSFEAVFEVSNPGGEALPYAIGFHPGFRWPFAGGKSDRYAVIFDEEESASVPVITRDGLFTERRRAVPLQGRRLPLSHGLMADEALCFLNARSRRLRFSAPDGVAIAVETEEFSHFALWSRPPAEFLCIEAWTGYGDPEGYSGELADKPSITWLEPGMRKCYVMRCRLEKEV